MVGTRWRRGEQDVQDVVLRRESRRRRAANIISGMVLGMPGAQTQELGAGRPSLAPPCNAPYNRGHPCPGCRRNLHPKRRQGPSSRQSCLTGTTTTTIATTRRRGSHLSSECARLAPGAAQSPRGMCRAQNTARMGVCRLGVAHPGSRAIAFGACPGRSVHTGEPRHVAPLRALSTPSAEASAYPSFTRYTRPPDLSARIAPPGSRSWKGPCLVPG